MIENLFNLSTFFFTANIETNPKLKKLYKKKINKYIYSLRFGVNFIQRAKG